MTKSGVENDYPTAVEALTDSVKKLKYKVHAVILTSILQEMSAVGNNVLP